jgi:hypothetical protein
VRLDRHLRLTHHVLGGGVLGSRALAEERRDGDRGQDADDQDDDQQLDEREALLLAAHPDLSTELRKCLR